MNCTTVKPGVNCAFMKKEGCSASGGACQPIIAQCEGCEKTVEVEAGKFCTGYTNPTAKWKTGECNFATHIQKAKKEAAKMNPLKASKKAAASKKKK